MVKGIGLMFTADDGCIPVISVLHVFGITAQVLNGCGHHIGTGFGFRIEYFNRTLVTTSHHIPRIIRIKSQKCTFATGRGCPAGRTDTATAQFPAGY